MEKRTFQRRRENRDRPVPDNRESLIKRMENNNNQDIKYCECSKGFNKEWLPCIVGLRISFGIGIIYFFIFLSKGILGNCP